MITDGTKQPLNIFECAISVMKNSEDFASKSANDPLGAHTLARVFSKSGLQIRGTGVKYEAIICNDSNEAMEVDSEDDSKQVKIPF